MEEGTIYPDDNGEASADRAGTAAQDSVTEDGTARDASQDVRSGVDRERTRAIEQARQERKANSDELRGLRAKLMDELDKVRNQLNDGTRTPDQRNEDQARAAALAQGLERLDRALGSIDASSEAAWADIKDNTEKEVQELRAWMEENEVRGS